MDMNWDQTATLTKFDDVGHSVHFDALEPFVQDLAAFLQRVD